MKVSILTNLFTECWWWLLLWMFLAFLLGWLLRKLLGGDSNSDCCDELEKWKRKYANLEGRSKNSKKGARKKRVDTVTPVAASLGANAVKGNAYAKLKNDNLQIVEGIGPKMDEVLKKHGIGNWSDLAGNTPSELRFILDKANPKRYKIIDPTTWSDQAQLAVNAKWQELIAMQKNLDTGKTNTTGNTDSKLEKIMVRMGLIKKWRQNDLKAIEGIGPKIAGLLHESGISTWKLLATASVDKLNEVLTKAGPRFKLADPASWPKQAQLADEGKWDELQEYQDFLDGGK